MIRTILFLSGFCLAYVHSWAESEPVEDELKNEAPYSYAGRLFAGATTGSMNLSGSGAAVGPGVVLTAAHVYWREAWEDTNDDNTLDRLPVGASPWQPYQKWYPAASSPVSESYDNVVSLVSLAGYDDVLHEYDDNRQDGRSPFEAFNRDSLLLIFSDDDATPNWIQRSHPQAAETGFLGQKNFIEVVGYPSAKYSGSDSRKWRVHRTTERDAITLDSVPSSVLDGGYSYANRLFFGGEPLDSYAGNSGGPVLARARGDEPWLLVGVYVGSNALIRGMDAELSSMIDTAIVAQNEEALIQFRLSASEVTVTEGGEIVQVGVERLGDISAATNALVSLVNLTSGESSDILITSDLSWEAGEGGMKFVSVEPVDDEFREGTESYLLQLGGDPATLSSPNTAVINVGDNDLNESLDQWTFIDEVGAVDYSEIKFAKNTFVSVGMQNAVYWTPDFSETGVMEFPNLNRLFQLTYARGLFIGSGDGPQLILSEDGREWEIVELPTSIKIRSTQYGQGIFVAVGGIDSLGASQGEVWVSEDARNWNKVYDERHDIFDDVEFGNGIFLARAGEELYRSPDGLSWSAVQTNGLAGEPGDMEFGDGVFISVGRNGAIYSSDDGTEWTLLREEDGESWYGVGFRNGYFVATGVSGKVATSSDGGITWVDRLPDTPESLWHGIAAAGKMTVIGNNGLLMTADLPEFFDFVQDPFSQDAILGTTVSLFSEYVTTYAGPFTLQWEKDGIALPGETAPTLSFFNASEADEGIYQMVVTGPDGIYRSSLATVSVGPLILKPENLVAFTSTSRGVTLQWTDESIGETGYTVERRLAGSDSWELISMLSEDANSYTDRSLVPEANYEYRVSTVSSEGMTSAITEPVQTLPATNLINLSTRGLVGSGDEVMIGGFIIPEGPDMTLYIRGLGPSLLCNDIVNTIADPHLNLVPQSPGLESFAVSNDDWMGSPDVDAILAAGLPPEAASESALLMTLPPGAYTIILSDETQASMAVGMIEIFDITEDCSDCRLINLSTRGPVASGSELMIGGLIVSGGADKKVLVRAAGPSLPSSVSNPLQDPLLRMVPGLGDEALIDSWIESVNADTFAEVGLSLGDDREPGEIFQIGKGSYTFLISGADGGSGVALLEVFEME